MSPFAINLEKSRTETSVVRVEPALNAFGSMVLVSKDDGNPGIHEWVIKTRAQMSAEESFRHKLVTIGFHYAINPVKSYSSFEAYIADLETTPPSVLRERLLTAYEGMCLTEESRQQPLPPVGWSEVLISAKNYVDFLRFRFGPDLTDEEVETRAYEYVVDPAALKQLVTGHIRWFWKNHLQAEWNRVRPMLEESARAFNKMDLSGKPRMELIQFITGKEFNEAKWSNELKDVREFVFIPNAHIGPYVRSIKIEDTFYLYFGAHLPEGSDVYLPELDRAELVSRLSALADDTRLHILQMIAENGEMRSQEIMEAINLSQPSVSRYLTQLTATGYLQERRESGAKVYILNRDRIEKTLKAISAFLLNRT